MKIKYIALTSRTEYIPSPIKLKISEYDCKYLCDCDYNKCGYWSAFVKSNEDDTKDDFETQQLKIAYATARTLCSHHVGKQELYFDIIASLLNNTNAFSKNNSEYLQLCDSRLKRLRDFSRKSRIGELAQGVNYLFVQEELGYPYIVDFHLYMEKDKEGIPYGSKTPDFVIAKKGLKKAGLFESKGESSKKEGVNNKTGKLHKAYRQLLSIKRDWISELIPVCVRFENDDIGGDSRIHYGVKKILKAKEVADSISINIFRRHYASWFYLIGDFKRSDVLLSGDGGNISFILNTDANYELGEDDRENEVYWLSELFVNFDSNKKPYYGNMLSSILFSLGIRIGIYKEVADALDMALKQNQLPGNLEYPTDSDNTYLRFADGIIIQLREPENKKAK